jgi:short-subunit dehydrogenase
MTKLSTVRSAIVTGAASGMGRLTAQRLNDRGIKVLALDFSADQLGKLAADAPAIQTAVVDVRDHDALATAVAPALDDCDLLVTAAGIGHTGRVLETDNETFEKLIGINYLGTVATVKLVLPGMVARQRGHVVMYASMAGWVPAPQHAPYNSTKAAVMMFADCLRLESKGKGVGFTAMCPPAVATPLLDDMPVSKAAAPSWMKPLTPEKVVLAVEKAIESNTFIAIPDLASKAMWRMRRHTPRLVSTAIGNLIKP